MSTSRRGFTCTLGAAAGLAGLSGCLSGGLPGGGGSTDRTIYIGAYHWGFILLDEDGEEREQIVLNRDTSLRLVGFNTDAKRALETLPTAVRKSVPEHEALEERNKARIPLSSSDELHELLEEANKRYPVHSVVVMQSGRNHIGGGMWDGMTMHPIELLHDATRPTTATLSASQQGDYTLSCLTDCGYGHTYMDRDSALVVR